MTLIGRGLSNEISAIKKVEMNTSILRGLSLVGAAAATAVPVIAQSEAGEDDIFELSPFTVNAEEDQGYRAQNTLSGTRLKSSLTDVGASISVMTKDLLDDIGATDVTDAFLYSTNTENENEFAADDSEGISITTTNSNRVRGIASSTYSRGFFDTNVRGDSYNTERFTMAYGPNSILYGLGSPAGMVNSTTKRATTTRDLGEFAFRFDTDNGRRYTADYNKVLIEDRFALRVALMDQEKKSWKQPDSDEETRIFLTGTVLPFEGASFRFNYEGMENNRVKSPSGLPDQAVLQWIENGKPLYDHINERITYDNGATWEEAPRIAEEGVDPADWALDRDALYAMGIAEGAGTNQRVVISDSNTFDPSIWNAIEDPDQRALYTGLNGQGLRWIGTSIGSGRADRDARPDPLVDGTLLPLDYSVKGLTNFADFESDTYSAVWEQKITPDLFVELAYNKENWSRDSFDTLRGSGTNLESDTSFYLPVYAFPNADQGIIAEPNQNNSTPLTNSDGSPVMIANPNAGRFFVEGQSRAVGYVQNFDFETFRFTASYDLDFTERNKWLGKHSVALLYQKDDKVEEYTKVAHWSDEDALVRGMGRTENTIVSRFYIDPPVVGTNGQTGPAYAQEFQQPDNPLWQTYRWAEDLNHLAHSKRELEGQMAVFQSRFLENRLITTFGFRRDSETLYQTFGSDEPDNPLGRWAPLPEEPTFPKTTGDTTTTGAVFAVTDWLKLFYNKSDSFLPQAHLHDYYNQPLSPADGEGEDIGFMLDMADGKFFTRVSWFEQSANGALELDWDYERMKWRLVNFMETHIERWSAIIPERPEWAAERGLSVDDVFRPNIGDNLRSIRDFKAKGMEVELIAKPIKGLDLRFTFGKNTSVNSRTLPNLQAYVADRMPVWEKYELLASAPNRTDRIPDPADPSQDVSLGETRGQVLGNWRSIGNKLWVSNEGLARLSFAEEEEGNASARARKYRANFIANYRFSEGKLKGFGIGTGIRYRSKAAIGYEGKPNPLMTALLEEEPGLADIVDPLSFLTSDITKPIYGDPILNYDAWMNYRTKIKIGGKDVDWRLQMNIYNLFDDTGLLARNARNDGTISRYMPQAPRRIAITNTFKF